ncbi:MAG: hypothetical protein COV70_01620 [Parcubacteria group bacterium CG11_big_fil_rev_8_21_14_0_20_39_22]|nr:MAG: hypothetical protein COV70_01620 [Parcubacteria group bacterium CG11_big_fil_rev_8_21_14_0_20_39_22]
MLTSHTHRNLVWIDLDNPTEEEIHWVMDEYGVNQIVARELMTPTLKPKVDLYRDYIYLILHFPTLNRSGGPNIHGTKEIDFIIGKDFIITAHYGEVDFLHRLAKIFEVNSLLDGDDLGSHAGFLFFFMIREAYQTLENELDSIKDRLELAQANIFNGLEREMVIEISRLSRDLLDFTRATKLHREILHSFDIAGKKFFGDGFSYELHSVINEYYKVESSIESNRAFLLELRSTNNSLITTKQNEVMKILTIMAFVTFPLSLLAGIFGMNTAYMPIVGQNYDFWIIIVLMALLTGSFFYFFKKNKWL